jgi:replicative DNA helicase
MATTDLFIERNYRAESTEQEVLAFICKVSTEDIARIDPLWMSNVMGQNIIKVQKDIRTPLTKDALMTKLRNGKYIKKGEQELYDEYLNKIYEIRPSVLTVRAFKTNIETVIEMFEGRTVLQSMKSIIKNIKHLTVAEIKQQLQIASTGVRVTEEVNSGNYTENFQDRYDSILKKRQDVADGKSVGIPTGIRAFDNFSGGLMRSEFGVIGGKPGVGKTAALVSFALSAWQRGFNVLFVSGEMPRIDIELRMDSNIANIPGIKFRLGNLTEREMNVWRRKIEQEGEVHQNFLEVASFPRNFTCRDIENKVYQIQDHYEGEVNLICLDYLNIMSAIGVNSSAKSWESQAEGVVDFKSLCAELNGGISGWTASQIKDEAIDADVLSLEDFKYARSITETAPVVVGLVRTQDDADEDVIQLQILKMRNAELPNKAIILRPNLQYMRIYQELEQTVKDFSIDVEEFKALPPKKQKRKDFSRGE